MKKERGSITLFVLIAMMFFLIILIGIYLNIMSKNQEVKNTIDRIEKEYSLDEIDLDQVYQEIINKEQEVKISLRKLSDDTEYISGTWINDSVIVNIEFPASTQNKIIYINGVENTYNGEFIVDETTNIQVNSNDKIYDIDILIDKTAPEISIELAIDKDAEIVSEYMSDSELNKVNDSQSNNLYGPFKSQNFSVVVNTTDENEISLIEYKISSNNVTANASNYNNLGNVLLNDSISNREAGTQTTTFSKVTLSNVGRKYVYVKVIDVLGNVSYAKFNIYVFNNRERFVVLAYNNILGRAPEYGGYKSHLDVLESTLNGGELQFYDSPATNDVKVKAIIDTLFNFYGSEEYINGWWNTKSKTEIVKNFFWGILRRRPSDSEVIPYVNSNSERTEYFKSFAESSEALEKFKNYDLSID